MGTFLHKFKGMKICLKNSIQYRDYFDSAPGKRVGHDFAHRGHPFAQRDDTNDWVHVIEGDVKLLKEVELFLQFVRSLLQFLLYVEEGPLVILAMKRHQW